MMHRFTVSLMVSVLGVLCALPATAAWETPTLRATTQEMAAAAVAPATGITTAVHTPYFKITGDDVAAAVAEQLRLQAIEEKSKVSLAAGTPSLLYSADHAIKPVIHALQIDTTALRWQAQLNIIAGGKTVSVKPVSGTYIGLVDVPVVTRQLSRSDVIESGDLSTRAVPKNQLRKETVTDASRLIGQSPRATISANRPIRMSEVSAPIVIKKGDAVQMTYTSNYMSIRATGVALQDGAKGELIRIKNDKSEKAVSGRVKDSGHVEVNLASAQ